MITQHLLTLAAVIQLGATAFMAQAVESVSFAPTKFNEPVIPGFHADPSICRVGDDYYLVNSSFEYFPGVPIFHSRDLVHWRQLGHVLTRKSQLNLDHMRASGGIFAPTLRYHDGTFYMITTLVWGGGNFYVTSTNAAGPWSEPVWLDKDGIDPSLFFDDNGEVYYTRQVGGEHGFSGQQLLNVQAGKLEGNIKELWRGTGGRWPEGPHLYKINGKYYLMISEGGTSYDHSLTVARSDSPWGPFEANPRNPILTHRNLPENPFQAMGHGDLVETADGWWVTFLGFRPQSGRFHHLGRETFLAPVTWENGWPVINDGKPIAARINAPKLQQHPWPEEPTRDEFDKAGFRPCWTFIRNPEMRNYSLTERPGWLRLKGSAPSLNDVASPTFVGRCQTDFNSRMAAKISFEPQQTNEEAGLVLRGNDRNHVEIVVTKRDGKRSVGFRKVLDGEVVEPVIYHEVPAGALVLSIQAASLSYEFFWTGSDGMEHQLGAARTRDLSTETLTAQKGAAFNFTGVFVGMFASGNGRDNTTPADFDWFEYDGQDAVQSGSASSAR